ncbi:hypothetical protein AALP_AAs52154U000100 [Arabis alpina]|uniref:Ubiquitin-like protease family profile domain-containing protein n=1 Tax=Arabis alpina TaxID=50452 RepID=A0A087FYR8_ARAAL|nr:hypothetical protein AALP_AAs52154U000100 [Arabis alpina]
MWVYEAIPAIGKKCGNPRKYMIEFPPLLRWKGSRKRCKFDLPQNREAVLVKGVMENVVEDLWDDEVQDEKVDNMLLHISGSSDKSFEKHFWEEKGQIDGPGPIIDGEDELTTDGEGMPLKKKHKSKMTADNNNDALKTYLASVVEQVAQKLQTQISTCIDVVKNMDSRMENIEKGLKGIQETNREELKPLSKYELKDISVEDLPTEEDTMDTENSVEQAESVVKSLSETSSIRDRNMKKEMDNFSLQLKSLLGKKPIERNKKPAGKNKKTAEKNTKRAEKDKKPAEKDIKPAEKNKKLAERDTKPAEKERRIRKLAPSLKYPFTSTIKESLPWTAYDPFKLVEETLVVALKDWMTRDLTVSCGNGGLDVGKTFFQELMHPQTHISDSHVDAGMALFRRRSLSSPCPYRGGRMAFMDSGFTVAIAQNYKKFSEDPKSYKWKSGAVNYYKGLLPVAGCTNKQLGKDVDHIYVIIDVKAMSCLICR